MPFGSVDLSLSLSPCSSTHCPSRSTLSRLQSADPLICLLLGESLPSLPSSRLSHGSSSSLPSYVAFIEGFHLFDPDEGVAIVRADVNIPSTGYTFLSLNVDHLGTSLSPHSSLTSGLPPCHHSSDQVTFNSQIYCSPQAAWLCRGDGFSDTSMTFVGTPKAVENVLNGMQYLVSDPVD
jgi:hypothetical protein